jgi:hypothetical protein
LFQFSIVCYKISFSGLRIPDSKKWGDTCAAFVLGDDVHDGVDHRRKICYSYTSLDIFGALMDVPTWGPWGKKPDKSHKQTDKRQDFFILDIFGALVDVPTWRPWGKSTH